MTVRASLQQCGGESALCIALWDAEGLPQGEGCGNGTEMLTVCEDHQILFYRFSYALLLFLSILASVEDVLYPEGKARPLCVSVLALC